MYNRPIYICIHCLGFYCVDYYCICMFPSFLLLLVYEFSLQSTKAPFEDGRVQKRTLQSSHNARAWHSRTHNSIQSSTLRTFSLALIGSSHQRFPSLPAFKLMMASQLLAGWPGTYIQCVCVCVSGIEMIQSLYHLIYGHTQRPGRVHSSSSTRVVQTGREISVGKGQGKIDDCDELQPKPKIV